MYFGPFSLGGTAYLICSVENPSGIAVAADALPTFRVYSGSSVSPVATGTTSVFDSPTLTGCYLAAISITGAFSRGRNYNVVVSYEVTAQPRHKVFSMTIN